MLPTSVELLRDILREAEFLAAQAVQTTVADFLTDEVLKRAFVRSVEVIGGSGEESAGGDTRGDFPRRMAKDGRDA